MPQATPEEPENSPQSEHTRRLMSLMSTEEFQKLPLSEKFRKWREFDSPKGPPITREDIEAVSASERAKRRREFMDSEEVRNLHGPERMRRLAEFEEELEKLPLSEAEKRWKEWRQSWDREGSRRASGRATEGLQAIRLLSSARAFLRGLGSALPAELIEIAREEGLDLPEVSELSPRFRDALRRAGWDEPGPLRDF